MMELYHDCRFAGGSHIAVIFKLQKFEFTELAVFVSKVSINLRQTIHGDTANSGANCIDRCRVIYIWNQSATEDV